MPWDAVIAFGLAHLRLPPAQFWRLSLRELTACLKLSDNVAPLSRRELNALMRQFPDVQGS